MIFKRYLDQNMNNSFPKYHIKIYLTEDKRHTPFIVKGLLYLEKIGFIILRFKSMPMLFKNRVELIDGEFKRGKKGYPWCPELLITKIDDNSKLRIGIDLQDWENYFSYHSLKSCNYIYKRAMTLEIYKTLNVKKPNLFKPFGPNCNELITDLRYKFQIQSNSYKQLLPRIISNPLILKNKINSLGFSHKKFKNRNIVSNKYLKIEPPKDNYIFFQVECHNWGSKSTERINDYRAKIIRKLKNCFGRQFYGGMWFRGQINKKYEDCISNVHTDHEVYKNFIDNASIVISTNGFGNSIPWKLVECLKSGSFIISEKNKHLFSYPLNNDEVCFFENIDECIQLCKKYLYENELRGKQIKKAKEYYEKSLEPSNVLRNIIENSFK